MKYIPYPMYWHDVPIDISYIFKDEKPAGKHGFLRVEGEDFVFEDGTKMRFWGTNFNSGGNFPDFDYSEKTAKRLAKIGINIVRFHQLDSEWATPNIFQYSKGERIENTKTLNSESMKRLDYLIYCLKNEGIYMYLDMLTYRKFKSGDGVENALLLQDAARPYCIYNNKLIELQKEFMYEIWNHTNEFTSLKYKDEPAIILTEIINEGDMFSRPVEIEPYKSELEVLFKKYISDNQIEYNMNIDFEATDKTMLEFKIQVQKEYFAEMSDYLREIGVRVPITGTNWDKGVANTKTHTECDFCDGHTYFYDWNWKEYEKNVDNRIQLKEKDTMFARLSAARIAGKPFFVSEWDEPWPNPWRAESVLWLAAVGSLQGWMGCAIHTYTYSTMRDIDIVGKEVSSFAIGGIPYREGIFNTFNDPAKFGLFYHAALITRRADVDVANNKFVYILDEVSASTNDITDMACLSETSRVYVDFEKKNEEDTRILKLSDQITDKSSEVIVADNGQIYRDIDNGYGYIDTPMTKAVYGLVGGKELGITDMSLCVQNDFAVVAVSSITDKQIRESDNLMLTVVGRSTNKNMKYSENGKTLDSIGEKPIMVESIKADISINTIQENLRVWAVNSEGFFTGVIPSRYSEGKLKFTVGNEFVSMYYLIQAE